MYIDPGFGSLVFQAILALLISLGAYIVKMKGWFSVFKKKCPSKTPVERNDNIDKNGFLK